ncbi:MAG: adenylyltransferase/cytidyltransferase family protein [Bacteroidetes bacterium]|nr:adenylyltransferase/cytidyltransferase family protein [Bacteroidota bacterium]
MTTAFFPGKFQPVHLGHIITLMKIYDKYDKIIVGITEDEQKIMSQEEIKNVFENVLKHLPKFEIVLINGTIVNSTSPDNLPDFDVCVTGNPQVIDKLNKYGLKTEFIERSKGIGYSGSEIRSIIEKNI